MSYATTLPQCSSSALGNLAFNSANVGASNRKSGNSGDAAPQPSSNSRATHSLITSCSIGERDLLKHHVDCVRRLLHTIAFARRA